MRISNDRHQKIKTRIIQEMAHERELTNFYKIASIKVTSELATITDQAITAQEKAFKNWRADLDQAITQYQADLRQAIKVDRSDRAKQSKTCDAESHSLISRYNADRARALQKYMAEKKISSQQLDEEREKQEKIYNEAKDTARLNFNSTVQNLFPKDFLKYVI